MSPDKHPYEHLPIPSYEEATSSRPPSQLGPEETSDDAERQGLLPSQPASNRQTRSENRPALFSRWRNSQGDRANYRPPTAQSVADSDDDGLSIPSFGEEDSDGDDEALRHDIEQMEMLEPGALDPNSRSSARSRLSKRFSSLTTTLSSIHLPNFSIPRPNFTWLTQRLPSWPEQYRPGCAIVARLIGLFLVVSLVYALFVLEIIPSGRNGMGRQFNPEWVRSFAQGNIDSGRIRDNLRMISRYDHVAGSEGNWRLAESIEKIFLHSGMDMRQEFRYHVYLNYPKPDGSGRRVSIVEPKDQQWTAELEEDEALDNSPQNRQTYNFHGHSKSGTARGPLIYANYGSPEDFQKLADKGVNVTGSIVLVRHFGSQLNEALKVKAAEEAGAVGCLVYSDPEQDGFARGDVWPEGRWRTKDSVRRGALSLSNWIIGDVLSPGWASTPDKKRLSLEDNPGLVQIPSIPLAWRDAQKLLQALQGHGKKMGNKWQGAVPDINGWWTGDQESPVVELENQLDGGQQEEIRDVLGFIQGYEAGEKRVIIGNHRDSWCYGAVDPGSGTAILLEVARVLGLMRQQGWHPRRTIVIASWDAQEFNMMGSTEYVEDHLMNLRMNAYAYMNVGAGVSGGRFHAAGSPVFKKTLERVLGRVGDPVANQTVRDSWLQQGGKLESLGFDGDWVPFQSMVGTSSLDMGFRHKSEDLEGGVNHRGVPGFPSHSCYETFDWMASVCDPGFQYHEMLAQIWILMAIEFADEPIAPFDFNAYLEELPEYINSLEKFEKNMRSRDGGGNKNNGGDKKQLDLQPLRDVVDDLDQQVEEFNNWEETWYSIVARTGRLESAAIRLTRVSRNARMADFETRLLDIPDNEFDRNLPNNFNEIEPRSQFKHVLFGPEDWSTSGVSFFPKVRDALNAGDWKRAQRAVDTAADLIQRAGQFLVLPT